MGIKVITLMRVFLNGRGEDLSPVLLRPDGFLRPIHWHQMELMLSYSSQDSYNAYIGMLLSG